ncbi:beta-lactamase, putative [Talaromyces stipitatus ATCC 10500]|uniref:Beta-lactamase, putative n=1 Tax=Talaromyces stipitatus (strain ATCC 10500 / CBS 375.48 / QM 6759 / NRRL 1006) TaxID=441959 RepID=B8M2S3_TALSN|nr:beta-lactamase, putative [Talaromyces stipitatus ATCC 10500]EED22178.1 beta-lactamase, putative [Talaromyces stipitatus ATCC 10500]
MKTTMSFSQLALTLASIGLVSARPPWSNNGELVYGSPESVGMQAAPLHQMVQNVTAYTHAANYGRFSHYKVLPIEPGSANLVARNGVIVSEFAVGKRNLYADVNGTELPRHLQEDTTVDTVYDMASLTKLFTTVAALRELDAGRIELNATVVTYIPEFATNGKENITILELFTHTSGFDADPSPSLFSDSYTTYDERINAILTQKIINTPGSTYLYSDLNFMSLALVIQTVTGRPLDELIYDYTRPLGMTSTYFNRGNIEGATWQTPNYYRTATQEFQIAVLGPAEPQRPQPVRGTVHDENAWALDGVSGHAGLFSTVRDTAAFCQMILNNGTYAGQRILSQNAVDLIFTNFNARFPGDEHGLGFELNQYYTAGPMASLQTASHTGFTGTTLVIDRTYNAFWLHFSNRVHPSRSWSSNNIVREAVGYWVGKSLGLDVAFPPLS